MLQLHAFYIKRFLVHSGHNLYIMMRVSISLICDSDLYGVIFLSIFELREEIRCKLKR